MNKTVREIDFSDVESIEDLALVARAAFQAAPHKCLSQHACGEYHGIWPLARLANPNGSKLAGTEFFTRELASIGVQIPSPRILVSGGADTGLLALSIAAFSGSNCTPQFLFVDRCATPVLLNQQLLSKFQLNGRAANQDILETSFDELDVIVAHSFLIYFSTEDVKRLFAKWASLLRPGGTLLISNMVGNETGHSMGANDATKIQANVERILQASISLGFTDKEQEKVRTACERIFEKKLSDYPLATFSEIKFAMTAAGFSITKSNIHDRSDFSQRGPFSQGMLTGGQRIEIRGEKI